MSPYKRLPGRVSGFLHSPSVWLGDDHILVVSGSRFEERYHRVYLADVKAMVIKRRGRFAMQWWYLIALPLIVLAWNSPWSWLNIPLGLGLLAAGFGLAAASLREGCDLFLSTEVGYVKVPSVALTWTARRFAARLTPAIVAAQHERAGS